jgi:hypothetical protein
MILTSEMDLQLFSGGEMGKLVAKLDTPKTCTFNLR